MLDILGQSQLVFGSKSIREFHRLAPFSGGRSPSLTCGQMITIEVGKRVINCQESNMLPPITKADEISERYVSAISNPLTTSDRWKTPVA
ncbi:hypothetical protein [Rhizobium sp. BK068]|uniref:hypothetical protein n=1 Tax=Rhizobium sp. BK068 TaxID=2512130 RepID=UPI0010489AA3|nr:hypothetical protein [Rhizobium sp. BK068]TCM67616.1 hypothetical protein EV291_13323 [Rhizobium sp. BK068]